MANVAEPRPTSFPKDRIKVLLLENVHASAQQLFAAEHFQVEALKHALKEEELIQKISDVHVLGIRSKTQATAKVLAAGKRLLSVGCFCIGTNQVDLTAANRQGVPVFNAPFSNTRSVAELIISEIIALARKVSERSREVHAGIWNKASADCNEVRNKVLGIIGYGHIGRQLGVLAEAMGIRVIFFDITAKLPMGNNRTVATLDELLSEADFVSLHCDLNNTSFHLIGRNELKAMKSSACLINTARGPIVDEAALVEALREKWIAGAALDVFEVEPLPADSPLREFPNCLLATHNANNSRQAVKRVHESTVANLLNALQATQ